MQEFTNAVTALDQARLRTLVVAQSYLDPTATPPSPTSGLVLTMPAQRVVINTGGVATEHDIAPVTLSAFPANSDTYIDADPGSGTGYDVTSVSVGATPAAPASGTLRLYKATTNGSNITTVEVVAPMGPISGSMLATGVRQIVSYRPTVELTVTAAHQSVPSTTYSDWGHLDDIAITTGPGASLIVLMTGNPYNYLPGAGNWARMGVALDGADVRSLTGMLNSSGAGPGAFNVAGAGGAAGFSGLEIYRGLDAGTHHINLLLSGGGAGTQTSVGFKPHDGIAHDSMLTVLVAECA